MFRKLILVSASLAGLLLFSAAQAGEVARAVLTTGVVEREPVNQLDNIPADDSRVLFFTDIRDMTDKTVTHLWKHNGEVMAEVKFNVGGPRWRVWSSKNLMPEWSGDWTVSVVDEWGNTLAEKSFTYEAPAMSGDSMEEATGEPMPEEEASMESDKAMDDSAGEAAADKPMDDQSHEMDGEKAMDAAPAEEPMKAAE